MGMFVYLVPRMLLDTEQVIHKLWINQPFSITRHYFFFHGRNITNHKSMRQVTTTKTLLSQKHLSCSPEKASEVPPTCSVRHMLVKRGTVFLLARALITRSSLQRRQLLTRAMQTNLKRIRSGERNQTPLTWRSGKAGAQVERRAHPKRRDREVLRWQTGFGGTDCIALYTDKTNRTSDGKNTQQVHPTNSVGL